MDLSIGKYTFVVSVPFKKDYYEKSFVNGLQRRMRRGFEQELEDGLMVMDIGWEPFFLFLIEPFKYQVVFPDTKGVYPWFHNCEDLYKKQISFKKDKTLLLVTEDTDKVENLKCSERNNLFLCFHTVGGFSFAPIQYIPKEGIEVSKEPVSHDSFRASFLYPPDFYCQKNDHIDRDNLNISFLYKYIKNTYRFRRLKIVCKDFIPSFKLDWLAKSCGEYKALIESFADWRKGSSKIGKKHVSYSTMEWEDLPDEKREEMDSCYMYHFGWLYDCYDVDGHFFILCHSLDIPTEYILYHVRVDKNGKRARNYQLEVCASSMEGFSTPFNRLLDRDAARESSLYWELKFTAERNKEFLVEPFCAKGAVKRPSPYDRYVIQRKKGDYEGIKNPVIKEALMKMDNECVKQDTYKKEMDEMITLKKLMLAFINSQGISWSEKEWNSYHFDDRSEEETKRGLSAKFKAVGGFTNPKNLYRLEVPVAFGFWCCFFFTQTSYFELTHFETLEEAKALYSSIEEPCAKKSIVEVQEGVTKIVEV